MKLTTILLTIIGLVAAQGAIDKDNISYGGSGCPQGTSGLIVGDANRFIVIRTAKPAFRAAVGPNIAATESRKTCQIGVPVSATPGTQFAISSSTFTGDANLSQGVTAVQSARYYFAGESTQVTNQITLNGYRRGGYTFDEPVADMWSPCGESTILNLFTAIRVSSSSEDASGAIAGRSGGEVWFDVSLKWRKC